jgi:hypothetical protein
VRERLRQEEGETRACDGAPDQGHLRRDRKESEKRILLLLGGEQTEVEKYEIEGRKVPVEHRVDQRPRAAGQKVVRGPEGERGIWKIQGSLDDRSPTVDMLVIDEQDPP